MRRGRGWGIMAVQVERAAEAYWRGQHEECLGLLQQGKTLMFAHYNLQTASVRYTVDPPPPIQLYPDWRGSAGSSGS